MKEAQAVLDTMIKVQQELSLAADSSNQGLTALREGTKQYAASLEHYHNAHIIMQTALNEIQKKTQIQDLAKAKEKLESARNEAAAAKERAGTIKEVAEYTEEQLKTLEKKVDDQFGSASVIFGGIVGTAAATISPLLILPVGGSGAAAFHYIRRVRGLASNLFNRRGTSLPTEGEGSPQPLGSIQIKYNESSTGWGGTFRDTALWATGKKTLGSKTEGTGTIHLMENASFTFQFNKNSGSPLGMMNPQDIKKLENELRKLLETKKLTPQDCLKLLDSLSRVESEHGILNLVTKDCLLLRDLRKECLRQI